jgi:glycosyltransferase involved in cell wall biosynthesis
MLLGITFCELGFLTWASPLSRQLASASSEVRESKRVKSTGITWPFRFGLLRGSRRIDVTATQKQRVGVVPILQPSFGGLHQYSLQIISLLGTCKFPREIEFVLLTRQTDESFINGRVPANWRRLEVPEEIDWVTTLQRAERVAISQEREGVSIIPQATENTELRKFLQSEQIDWLFLSAPVTWGFEAGIPYVMPVHDLQHRLQPNFPEVSQNGQWELREYLYRNGIAHASQVIVESAIGLKHVRGLYHCEAEKIVVIPYNASDCVSKESADESTRRAVRSLYALPEKFLFYPAQFWPHKNHCRIVEAIWVARQLGSDISVVFCGNRESGILQETAKKVLYIADRLGISDNLYIIGYAEQAHMSALYAEAVGLIMPTFFGPSNIPILEAWATGCPVITSNIQGLREQAGRAALLVDPLSVNSIASAMIRLWKDAKLREELVRRGTERLALFSPETSALKLRELVLSMATECTSR